MFFFILSDRTDSRRVCFGLFACSNFAGVHLPVQSVTVPARKPWAGALFEER